jgi:DNA mismatch endonuclease (patch repair protein)
VLTPEQRRRNMQAVRSRDTCVEVRLRARLRERGLLGYRNNARGIMGRPDLAYTRWKVAVFVDGCFWHGCPECYIQPASNEAFWANKLKQNRARDEVVTQCLSEQGWTIIRVWEHEAMLSLEGCADRVAEALAERGRRPRSL